MRYLFIFLCLLCITPNSTAQKTFSAKDSLRGGYGPGRNNWDLLHYEISITPDFATKSLKGINKMRFRLLQSGPFQIDLQQPMIIDSIILENVSLGFNQRQDAYFIEFPKSIENGIHEMIIYFHGIPREAKRAPWDGGWIFTKDRRGNPWMTVACQGLGASAWFPCKESQADEPDNGVTLHIETPDSLAGVGNGRLIEAKASAPGKKNYTWQVINPINNYNIAPYIGKYVNFNEIFRGEKGSLDLDYWVLDYNREKAGRHLQQVPGMLEAFEYWFGPYPFYEDGFKIVEAPFAGMEHQSAIAYGNNYVNGYSGSDLSGTGIGLKWDFMIVHESGHEWFGNSITSKDIADMWIHESFTTYSEVLYTEYHFGKEEANQYSNGYSKRIDNRYPCIGEYGVHDNPSSRSSDVYGKGSAMLHTIRQVCGDDKKFRKMLREMNRRFYHSAVTSKETEKFICDALGIHPTVFDQYLRSIRVPELEYQIINEGRSIKFKWNDAIEGFKMPVRMLAGNYHFDILPDNEWKEMRLKKKCRNKPVSPDPGYYINSKQN